MKKLSILLIPLIVYFSVHSMKRTLEQTGTLTQEMAEPASNSLKLVAIKAIVKTLIEQDGDICDFIHDNDDLPIEYKLRIIDEYLVAFTNLYDQRMITALKWKLILCWVEQSFKFDKMPENLSDVIYLKEVQQKGRLYASHTVHIVNDMLNDPLGEDRIQIQPLTFLFLNSSLYEQKRALTIVKHYIVSLLNQDELVWVIRQLIARTQQAALECLHFISDGLALNDFQFFFMLWQLAEIFNAQDVLEYLKIQFEDRYQNGYIRELHGATFTYNKECCARRLKESSLLCKGNRNGFVSTTVAQKLLCGTGFEEVTHALIPLAQDPFPIRGGIGVPREVGLSVIECAALFGFHWILSKLDKNPELFKHDDFDRALTLAIDYGHLELLKKLEEIRSRQRRNTIQPAAYIPFWGFLSLQRAVRIGHHKMVEFLHDKIWQGSHDFAIWDAINFNRLASLKLLLRSYYQKSAKKDRFIDTIVDFKGYCVDLENFRALKIMMKLEKCLLPDCLAALQNCPKNNILCLAVNKKPDIDLLKELLDAKAYINQRDLIEAKNSAQGKNLLDIVALFEQYESKVLNENSLCDLA